VEFETRRVTCQNLVEANQLNLIAAVAMPKFDDMNWHLGGGEFPLDLPAENATTHIGFFVAWAINNGLWGKSEDTEESLAIQRVRDRSITGRTFLIEQCDGKMFSGMLNNFNKHPNTSHISLRNSLCYTGKQTRQCDALFGNSKCSSGTVYWGDLD